MTMYHVNSSFLQPSYPTYKSSLRNIAGSKGSEREFFNTALKSQTVKLKNTYRAERNDLFMSEMSVYSSARSSQMSVADTISIQPYVYSSRKEKVIFNVSGEIYETLASTLNKYPETLLGTSEKRKHLTDKKTHEIFLNRHRTAFEAVLFYYQSSGSLSRPSNISMEDFEKECLFYQIPSKAIKQMKSREHYLYKRPNTLPRFYSKARYYVWSFIDYPSVANTLPAFIYFIFSYLMMLSSVAVFCLESELIYFINHEFKEYEHYLSILYKIEFSLNIFFMLELVLRFSVNPYPKEFFKKTINLMELLSFSIYFLFYFIPTQYIRSFFINISRVFRAFRLARFSKVSKQIKIATAVFKVSVKDLFVVLYMIVIICILCGSIMYYIEMKEPGTEFTSIPQSMWWAVQTVLCLGYGDIVPTSTIGKIVGFFILYFGVTSVTVLVLALGGRFFDMYSKELYEKGFLPEGEGIDYEIHYKDEE